MNAINKMNSATNNDDFLIVTMILGQTVTTEIELKELRNLMEVCL
jgi:hypothetical protein